MQFEDASWQLVALARQAGGELRGMDERLWTTSPGEGKWTRLELLGHLIDSAANNHQRFVRAMLTDEFHGDGYDQEGMVKVQRYADASPSVLIGAWEHYNLLLAWVISAIPADKLNTPCSIGNAPPVTLRELVLDYIAHLEHHLRQLLEGAGATVQWSKLQWAPAN